MNNKHNQESTAGGDDTISNGEFVSQKVTGKQDDQHELYP